MIKYCVGHFMIEIKINVEEVVRIDHISLTKLVSPCVDYKWTRNSKFDWHGL